MLRGRPRVGDHGDHADHRAAAALRRATAPQLGDETPTRRWFERHVAAGDFGPMPTEPSSVTLTHCNTVAAFVTLLQTHVAETANQQRAETMRQQWNTFAAAGAHAQWILDQSCPSPTPVEAVAVVDEPAPAAQPATFPLKVT